MSEDQVEKALRDEFAAWITGHPNAALFDWQVATENVLRAANPSGVVDDRDWLASLVLEFASAGPHQRRGLNDSEYERFDGILRRGQS